MLLSPICFRPFLEEFLPLPPSLANVVFQEKGFLKVLSDIDY